MYSNNKSSTKLILNVWFGYQLAGMYTWWTWLQIKVYWLPSHNGLRCFSISFKRILLLWNKSFNWFWEWRRLNISIDRIYQRKNGLPNKSSRCIKKQMSLRGYSNRCNFVSDFLHQVYNDFWCWFWQRFRWMENLVYKMHWSGESFSKDWNKAGDIIKCFNKLIHFFNLFCCFCC